MTDDAKRNFEINMMWLVLDYMAEDLDAHAAHLTRGKISRDRMQRLVKNARDTVAKYDGGERVFDD